LFITNLQNHSCHITDLASTLLYIPPETLVNGLINREGWDMTKKMVNVAVLVAVLAVAVMAPSTTFAAGQGSQVVKAQGHGIGLIEMVLRLVGFNPVRGSEKDAPTQSISPAPSTDTATWTGGGRCLYGC
jgi:hypothetical protein